MVKYSFVSLKKREQLIEEVISKGKTIVSASKKLRIKLPTAKSILRAYRKRGKLFHKKEKAKKPQLPIIPEFTNLFRKSSISTDDPELDYKKQAEIQASMLIQNLRSQQ